MSIKGKGYSEETLIETVISESCLFFMRISFMELRFCTIVRDIPPFLPQRLGLEWTSMALSGLSPKAQMQ